MILYSAVFASKASSVEVRDLPSSLNATMHSASRVQNHGTKINKEEIRSFWKENLICSFKRTIINYCSDIRALSVEKLVWISFLQSTFWLAIVKKSLFKTILRSKDSEFAAMVLLRHANSEMNATISTSKRRKVFLESMKVLSSIMMRSLLSPMSTKVILLIHFGIVPTFMRGHWILI